MWVWIPGGITALLAGLAVFTFFHTRAVERRHPALGELLTLADGDVHILRKGRGVPVVLIHGATSNLLDWTASIFDVVATRHQAIAVDRPGHGWSERGEGQAHDPRVQARVLHRVFEQLGLERPLLVGHSLGGAVALAYALEYPGDSGGILFLAGLSHPWPGGVGRYYETGAHPILGRLLAWTLVAPAFQLVTPGAIRRAFSPNRPPPDYQTAAGVALYSRPANFVANAQDVAFLKPILNDMASRYGQIRAPLIALTGDRDNVIYKNLHTLPLVEKLPRAELRVLEGVGHMPHHAAPEAVLAAIDDLVKRREAR